MASGAEKKKKQSVISVLFYPMEDRRRNSSATHTFDRCCQVTEGLYKHSMCPFWHTRAKAEWTGKKKFAGKTERVAGEKVRLCYIRTPKCQNWQDDASQNF